MKLYYDSISKMYVLKDDQGSEFLGPLTNAKVRLCELGLNEKQTRESLLRALMDAGVGINIEELLANNQISYLYNSR